MKEGWLELQGEGGEKEVKKRIVCVKGAMEEQELRGEREGKGSIEKGRTEAGGNKVWDEGKREKGKLNVVERRKK